MLGFSPAPLDPRWREVAASLRKGTLHVKMPRNKVLLLVGALSKAEEDLIRKRIEESPRSFVFSGPVADWQEDLATLKKVLDVLLAEREELHAEWEVFQELVTTIEAGLRNDTQVDWIARVGGPPREDLDALEALEPQSGSPPHNLLL